MRQDRFVAQADFGFMTVFLLQSKSWVSGCEPACLACFQFFWNCLLVVGKFYLVYKGARDGFQATCMLGNALQLSLHF